MGHVPVVQWTERQPSKLHMHVRFVPGTPAEYGGRNKKKIRARPEVGCGGLGGRAADALRRPVGGQVQKKVQHHDDRHHWIDLLPQQAVAGDLIAYNFSV